MSYLKNKVSVISLDDKGIIDILNYKVNVSNHSDEPDSKRERLKKLMRVGIKQELTEKQRNCLLKRYVENRSVKDIAEEMNLTPANVYKHISKAKKRIARLYSYL